MSKLGKIFLWLTIPIIGVFILIYMSQLSQALSMDPNSFNCKYDSMMKQVCQDPYGSSISWTLVLMFMSPVWPIPLAWVVIGIVLLSRFIKRKSSSKANRK
jgi:hypothetical protein